MPQFRVTINDQAAAALLRRIDHAAADTTPLFRRLGNTMRNQTLANFRTGGWYGRAWPRSKRVLGMTKGKTLVRTAVLRNSVHPEFGRTWAAVGTSVPYAAIHQFGGTIPARTIRARNAKSLRFFIAGRVVFAKSAELPAVRIPARPYLPFDETGKIHPSLIAAVNREVTRHLGVR